jgi:hypothetical protein
MNIGQPLGIAVLAVGIALLIFGYNASGSPVEEISSTLTGRYTDNTMWYIIAGVAMVAAGGAVTIFGGKRT